METRPKLFTLDEANRTLPLVERIVRDIVELYPDFRDDLQRFHELATGPGTANAGAAQGPLAPPGAQAGARSAGDGAATRGTAGNAAAGGADGDAPAGRAELEALRRRIDHASERINGFIGELHEIGCLFKGFDEGLVDFYSLYRDRPIFLCWKLGEDGIRYWHEVEAGFAGRKPISSKMAAELNEPHAAELDALH